LYINKEYHHLLSTIINKVSTINITTHPPITSTKHINEAHPNTQVHDATPNNVSRNFIIFPLEAAFVITSATLSCVNTYTTSTFPLETHSTKMVLDVNVFTAIMLCRMFCQGYQYDSIRFNSRSTTQKIHKIYLYINSCVHIMSFLVQLLITLSHALMCCFVCLLLFCNVVFVWLCCFF
jgi:hypothetical protein